MKICVIGRPRTRSTIFLESIKRHHNLHNFGEQYSMSLTPLNFKDQLKISKFDIETQRIRNFENFKNLILESTKFFFSHENFVIKLWPRWIIYLNSLNLDEYLGHTSSNNQSLVNFLEFFNRLQVVTELNTYYKVSSYDKIYIVNRNVADSVSSFALALRKKNFNPKPTNLDFKLKIDLNNFSWIHNHLLEIIIQEKIKQCFDFYKLPYTELDYDEIPDYCRKNYSGTKHSILTDGQRDYKKIIENYSEVECYITDHLKKFRPLLDPIKFTIN